MHCIIVVRGGLETMLHLMTHTSHLDIQSFTPLLLGDEQQVGEEGEYTFEFYLFIL